MNNGRLERYSIEELEEALYRKKRSLRQQRLQRLKAEGRVVEVAGLPPPNPTPPPLARPSAQPTGALRRYQLDSDAKASTDDSKIQAQPRRVNWRWVGNKMLLLVEVAAVVGFLVVIGAMVNSVRELNADAAAAQREGLQLAAVAVPTETPVPLINVVVLPSGHKPPIDGRPPEQGEAGDIPAHLLPLIDAYVPPPVPTPGPQQARRIQIGKINLDGPIVQGDDWEQLKKGVGQHIGSAQPGSKGNMVLSAHNDIYGEIFRYLDKLAPGDEIRVFSERQAYTYVVNEIQVVEPTDVWVMEPTDHSQLTLISCYPYLVNNKRIVVFADLVETEP